MSKIKKAGYFVAGAVASAAIASKIMKKKAEKTTYKAEVIEPMKVRFEK